jgi:hypothetical protein
MSLPDARTTKVPCSECGGGYKNHIIHFSKERGWNSGEDGSRGADAYEVVECVGCDTIRFRLVSWNSEGPFDDESNEPLSQVTIYPPQEAKPPFHEYASARGRFSMLDPIPEKVLTIYNQTIQARDSRALILAAAGLRAIVEALCLSQGLIEGRLQQKIDALVDRGLLAKPQADALHEQRFLGNVALHEIEEPSPGEIDDGLQIVDALLHTIFVLPEHVARMKQKREARIATRAAKGETGNSD